MLSTNTLSVFIIHHHQNGICNKNLRLIQDIMPVSNPSAKEYKKVCNDFPNIAILTKSATPGEVQSTLYHVTVGNKYLGESVVVSNLAEDLDSPSVVSIKMEIAFSAEGENIRLPITEFLLRTAAGNLARSKKQRD